MFPHTFLLPVDPGFVIGGLLAIYIYRHESGRTFSAGKRRKSLRLALLMFPADVPLLETFL